MASRTLPVASASGPSALLVTMTGLAIMLNYIDRGAVSIAAPLIKDEMGLSATGYGLVVSSFFWTYVPFLLISGWLADRISVHRLMAAGVAVWALATLLTGFAGGLAALVALRLAMGVGEGVAFPCASKLMARAPEARRGTANTGLAAGLAMGPLIGTLAGGYIMAGFGWRPMFIVFGLVTLVWLLPWRRLQAEVDAPPARDGAAVMPYPRLLANPTLWTISTVHFLGTYALYFIIAWLPLYLVKDRGYAIGDMALLTAFFYFGQTIGATASGPLADRLIIRGRGASAVRRSLGVAGFVGTGTGIFAIGMTATTPALMAWLFFTSLFVGANTGTLFTIGQTLAGPGSAGRWVGVQSAVGNLSGIIGPVITGLIVDAAGYGPTFAITAGLALLGAAIIAFGIPRIAPVTWAATSAP